VLRTPPLNSGVIPKGFLMANNLSKSFLARHPLLPAVFVPLLFGFMSVGNLHVSAKLAAAEGQAFSEYVSAWYSPIPEEHYSGIAVMGIKRINTAFWSALFALAFGGTLIPLAIKLRKREKSLGNNESASS